MRTMRTVQIDEFRKPVMVRSVPVPEIGDDDALVRVTASGICRTDWHLWNQDWTWVGIKLPLPTTLGHETGGIVESVGSNVKGLEPGIRVTLPYHWACGNCFYCRKAQQNICDNAQWGFMMPGSGGWAEYVRVPNAKLNCVPLPSNVTELDASALGCRYMTAYRAVRTRAAVRGGETVAVVGVGGVGLAAIEIANALGAQVIAVDTQADRLQAAKKLGAVEVLHSEGLSPEQVGERVKTLSGGAGTDASIDAIGVNHGTLSALESLRKGGRMATVGMTTSDEAGQLTLPIDKLAFSEWSIAGSLGNPQSEFPELLAMIQNGHLAPRQHVSREVGLEDVQSVIDQFPAFETRGTVVITKF